MVNSIAQPVFSEAMAFDPPQDQAIFEPISAPEDDDSVPKSYCYWKSYYWTYCFLNSFSSADCRSEGWCWYDRGHHGHLSNIDYLYCYSAIIPYSNTCCSSRSSLCWSILYISPFKWHWSNSLTSCSGTPERFAQNAKEEASLSNLISYLLLNPRWRNLMLWDGP